MSPSHVAVAALVAFVLLAAPGDLPAQDAPAVSFPMERTVAEAGRTRMIAFGLAAPAAEDRVLSAVVGDPAILEVLLAPAVLAGQATGALRVRGLRAGETRLEVGGAALTVRVVAPRVADARCGRPRIVVPASGAVVWGGFSVGVEVEEDFASRVELRVAGGRAIAPRDAGDPALGPTRRLCFDLAAEDVRPGPLRLTAVACAPGGAEVAGPSVNLLAVAPPADLRVLEAEDQRESPRPERYGKEPPPTGVDPAASGQQYVGNWGSDPAACFPVAVEAGGDYQVFVTVRGDCAGGAFPTVGLIVDGAGEAVTNSPLADRGWHRIPLGLPVRLEAGSRSLTPYFLNDFWAESLADRNLYVDRLEVARVERVAAADPSGGGGMMAMAPAMMGAAGAGVRIAIAPPLDGRTALGPLEVRGVCDWPGRDGGAEAPWVTLWLNDRPYSRQRSAAPLFWVDADAFVPGANTLRLVAECDPGAAGESAVHTVTCRKPAPPACGTAFHRFTVRDPAWAAGLRERFSGDHGPSEQVSAAFFANGEAVLRLPESLTGAYHVLVEARGDDFEGPPVVQVRLRAGEGEAVPVGEAAVPTWWTHVPAGTVTLPAGPKELVFAFANDKYEEGKGDRNLWLMAAVLASAVPGDDAAPPAAEIAWPPADHEVWEADAVVADVWEDRLLSTVELLVDGRPTGVRYAPGLAPGPVLLPLSARGLAPGPHTCSVRAVDAAGRAGDSLPRPFRVAERAPESPGRYARALRLLDRLAYGADGRELAAILLRGEEAWLDDRLGRGSDDPGDADAREWAAAWFRNPQGDYDVSGRIVQHACATTNPVRARFLRWVENHFSTWIRKTGAETQWQVHEDLARLGLAPFPDLLFASARSPAMLLYLDAQESFAHRLNENYAREIMELHSLGVHGGYTQADVTALASILTGWMYADEGDGASPGGPRRRAFRFDPALNDGAARQVFGLSFPKAAPHERYDRAVAAVEWLAAHPSTARFVCRKLAEHYVSLPAPDALVDDLAHVFLETHGDLRAVVGAIARHPAFWDPARPEKVCSPFDFAVRLARAAGHPVPWAVIEFLGRSGMGVYDRPTPDGYPEEDGAWTDTQAMLQRWRFVRECSWALADVVPPDWRWSDLPWDAAGRQALVDVLAIRLLGRPLGAESNAAALRVLEQSQGSREELVQGCAALIAQLPEANLR